ncbi:hypothetical protein QF038_001874 [Pseudarthrobacter sp. W1I19]|uniref:restriction endonuclease n=1 Tax=Pseudarthrobacter sp. W1I19 TaxID=3042288 RepID=UPI00278AD6BB|nr:restriction endonuclease [Pseudarthrobacter sp. W1I19]MDQ0923366.1 hypothetical protein [Pseudarthrobacter sp. W1I19]
MTDGIRRRPRHYARERAVGVVKYLVFVLPRLMFWVAVKFLAIGLWHATKLVVPKIRPFHAEPSATDAPATASEPQVDPAIEELRARKRRRHAEGVDDWDHELEQLLESAWVQPATDTDETPQQPSIQAAPNQDPLGEVGEETADVRRELLSRFHADLVKVHERLLNDVKVQEARVAKSREDAAHLLEIDPRTMWAWAEYLKSPHNVPVDRSDAWQILAAIRSGEHVEIFAPAVVTSGFPKRRKGALPRKARFAARTFDSWIVTGLGQQADVLQGPKWTLRVSGEKAEYAVETYFSFPDGRDLVAYTDELASERFDTEGFGESILRLPNSSLAPLPPQLGASEQIPSPESGWPARLLGDWHSAEDVALWHMSGPLGFFGARLTGGVSDRGIDVEHPEAVAQVKMQANPVGSPQIRQLRGTRPQLRNHVFYSTSGFTRAAIEEAAETSVALFKIDDSAEVHPYGSHAKRLLLEGVQHQGGDDAVVAEYVSSVVERIRKTNINYGSAEAWLALRETDGANYTRITSAEHTRIKRAESYLKGAVAAVRRHPKIGVDPHKAVISHYRNADLRAAFFCQILVLPYPGDEPLRRAAPPTAADFY